MKIYLSNSSIPELEGLDKEQQKEALKYANKKAFKHSQTITGIVIMAIIVFIGVHFFGILGAAVGGGLGAFVYMQFMIPVARPHIAKYRQENNL